MQHSHQHSAHLKRFNVPLQYINEPRASTLYFDQHPDPIRTPYTQMNAERESSHTDMTSLLARTRVYSHDAQQAGRQLYLCYGDQQIQIENDTSCSPALVLAMNKCAASHTYVKSVIATSSWRTIRKILHPTSSQEQSLLGCLALQTKMNLHVYSGPTFNNPLSSF